MTVSDIDLKDVNGDGLPDSVSARAGTGDAP